MSPFTAYVFGGVCGMLITLLGILFWPEPQSDEEGDKPCN
jgi:hypothetical protein